MTRRDVAAELGVSERTVTSYSQNGRLTVSYLPGKTSPVADFDPDEVAALKAEMIPKTQNAKLEVRNGNEVGNNGKNSGAVPPDNALSLPLSNFQLPTSNTFLAVDASHFPALAQALKEAMGHNPPAITDIAAKIAITVTEACALTGLSEKTLRAAIKRGELPTRRIGRSDRLRPGDVRAWFDRQFEVPHVGG